MVNKHAAKLFTVMCLWLVTQTSMANTFFTLETDTDSYELGKPVHLILKTSSVSQSLSTIDLAVLRKYFYVDTSTDPEILSSTSQIWKLRLYPYHEGMQTIAPLLFNGQYSPTIRINITPALDPRTHMPVKVEHTTSIRTPWQRQQVLQLITITSRDKFSVFESKLPTIKNVESFSLRTIKTTDREVKENSYTRYTMGLALFPLSKGKTVIEPVAYNYIFQGKVTYRFYTPPVTLDVKPLPFYVPPTIAVGKLSITGTTADDFTAVTHKLRYWNITLHVQNMPASYIPTIESQLLSDKTIQLYPASQTSRQSLLTSGINSSRNYQVPYKYSQQGWRALPKLRLKYFDPDTGKLVVTRLATPGKIVMSQTLYVILYLLTGVLIAYIAYQLYQWLLSRYRYIKSTLRGTFQLHHAKTLTAMRDALRQLAIAHNWPENFTIVQWRTCWQARYKNVIGELNKLNSGLYGNVQVDAHELRRKIMAQITIHWWQRLYLTLYLRNTTG